VLQSPVEQFVLRYECFEGALQHGCSGAEVREALHHLVVDVFYRSLPVVLELACHCCGRTLLIFESLDVIFLDHVFGLRHE